MTKCVFDLDGTICFNGEAISTNILNALSHLERSGREVLFASARPIRDMLPVIDPSFHNHILIGGNGSIIWKDKKIIKANSFNKIDTQKILKLITQYNGTYLIDDIWDYAYTGSNSHPILKNVDPMNLATQLPVDSLQSIIKILLLSSDNDTQIEKELRKLDVFINKHLNENLIDISPKNINKWQALKDLGIPKHSYIDFGNDANDIPLFQNSLYSIMVGNNEALLPYADEKISAEEEAILSRMTSLSKNMSNSLI